MSTIVNLTNLEMTPGYIVTIILLGIALITTIFFVCYKCGFFNYLIRKLRNAPPSYEESELQNARFNIHRVYREAGAYDDGTSV